MATNKATIDRQVSKWRLCRKKFVLRVEHRQGEATRPSGVWPAAACKVTLRKAHAGYIAFIPRIPSLQQQCVATFLCARRLCTTTDIFTPLSSRTSSCHTRKSPASLDPPPVMRRSARNHRLDYGAPKPPVLLHIYTTTALPLYHDSAYLSPSAHVRFWDASFGAMYLQGLPHTYKS